MLNQTIHRQHIVTLLLRIYGNSFLGSVLGFKGGTAAYLFYDLPRFSVDLDFDLLPPADDNSRYREQIRETLTKHIGKEYEIIDQSNKTNTLFWLLSYKKGDPKIKIEISTRKFSNIYDHKVLYGATLSVMKLGDMIAHKLVSIQDRTHTANRDLFDAHFFLSGAHATAINYALIQERTRLQPHAFYTSLLDHLYAMTPHQKTHILDGLGELLTPSQKDWVKATLLDELIQRVKLQLDAWSTNISARPKKDSHTDTFAVVNTSQDLTNYLKKIGK